MNLKEMRDNDFENKFLHLLDTVKYYVAQDQDYLNRFCKGRVKIISTDWDRMPVNQDKVNDRDTLKLVHFNLAFKPWHFDNIPYQEYFWEYANKTEYIDQINEIKNNFSEEDKKLLKDKFLLSIARLDCVPKDFETLFKAYEIAKKNGYDGKLYIIRDGPDKDKVEKLKEANLYKEDILLLGRKKIKFI